MKKITTLFLLLFSLHSFAQMNGTYTIGGVSPDFSTIQQAINSLMNNGVNGPTIFLIRDGVYNQQLNFGIIPGTSDTSRVVFKSESNDSTAVEITYAAIGFTDNWVIQFDSTQYVSLQGVKVRTIGSNNSYTTVIDIKSFSDYVHIENCFLEGKQYASQPIIYAAQGSYYQGVEIRNNYLFQGGIGVNMRNDGGASFPNGQGVVVEGNQFVDNYYGAISMINHDYFEIRNNMVTNPNLANASGFDGFYFSNVNKGGLIAGNQIIAIGREGITINNCKNPITDKGAMYNNFISMSGTSTAYGMSVLGSAVVSSSKTSYWDIFNNTVIVNNSNSSAALFIYKSENNNLFNNIFYNNADGSSVFNNVSSTIVNTVMEYNVLFSLDTILGIWDNLNYSDLSSFQAITSTNQNSLMVNPEFNDLSDYHLCNLSIDNQGSNLFSSLYDLDGDIRDSLTPDIGADEFMTGLDNSIIDTGFATLTSNQNGATYQWLNCDNGYDPIMGETNQVFDASFHGNGNYAVEVNLGVCIDTSDCYFVLVEGVDEVINIVFNIYPNPTNGIFTVDLGNSNTLIHYKMLSVEGRMVEQGKTTENKIMLDLSNESQGVYFLQVQDGNFSKVYKILKQ